ncbi:MAG TPA: YlxR family protein [Candidatus Polarisedimenticolia bacterium]|nr:YlxR family protein [Candidatus Polarisedimenticolia bacterium]
MCRKARAKAELVRVVRAPDGVLSIDPSGRANGRGAYVCRDADCLTRAGGRSGLGHALRTEVPPELRVALAALLEPNTMPTPEVN